jgi:D-alanyl-D-alanine dipeptidase
MTSSNSWSSPPILWILALLVNLAAGGATAEAPGLTDLEQRMAARGLVDVQSLDPTIACELKYTTAANFMGEDVYGEMEQCFLLEDAARRLAVASAELREHYPELHLVVVDALRSRAVQRRMWALVKNTSQQPYVANPAGGSMHNYGAAVDITLADRQGNRLDMGTPLDHFGPLAQVTLEAQYRKSGDLSDEQLANRLVLRQVMVRAGFQQLAIEWWHYNAWDKHYVRKHFSIVESYWQ